ncbi:hypothetical protein DJ019_01935 [Phenylobacterium kunshanense]|uniref:Uncharacterized protein n=2 Tax=Phenylobacterium kunshanense TaxID=1445034 RepID=A0A328BS18_9CAUL|nr:hypothetical protein DJ019_01935 [Phenylobacterium kunshanense]
MAPPKMRVRAKSKAKVWSAWTAARKLALPKTILAGFARYKSMDTDLPRSGGPGLHIWLKDRAWEPWVGGVETDRAASWTESEWSIAMRIWRETGTWGEGIGAPPGQPGCRVPARLLVQPAHTTGATA